MGLLGESSVLVVVGYIVSIGAFVIQLIGFSTPYWYKLDIAKVNYGLWQLCISDNCESFPSGHRVLSDQFNATRAMECLAFIALLVAVVLIVVRLFVLKDMTILYLVIAGCNFFGGLTAFIGIITYVTIEGGDSSTLHFSFALCIVAAVAAIVAGILIIIGKNQNKVVAVK